MNSLTAVEKRDDQAAQPATTSRVVPGRSPSASPGCSRSLVLPELDLLRAAVMAPSPDNNQPWRFRFDDGKLFIYEDHARRLPSDVCSMFAMLGLGAAAENVVVEASRYGLAAKVICIARINNCDGADRSHHGTFPKEDGRDRNSFVTPVAEVDFCPGAEPDRLAAMMKARCTNRRAYSREPVAGGAINQLSAAAKRFDDCRVEWLIDRTSIRRISKLIAAADRLRFERAEFHGELFRQLRLTPREAERTRDGLDLRTLGLPPGGGIMLRSLKSWPVVRTLNWVGLSRMLTAPSATLVRNSGAVGVLSVSAPTTASFFDAGRAFERLWLTATDLGLSLHPLGSLPIFVGHHELLGGHSLDERHAKLAANLSQELRALLPAIAGQTPTMLFRTGISAATSVRSLRRAVEDVLEPPSKPDPQTEALS